jgi:hypothetical protein
MKGEQAHLALLSRIERALDAASTHKVLAAAADTVARSAADARTAIAHLDGVADELALLHSRRLAELLADTVNGALLLDDAAWSLDRDGDARKAAVARRFVTRKLANERARGILNMDRSVLDHFEPLIRYGRIEADELAA